MRKMSAQKIAPAMVSFYHRVADENPNPWTISRREFRRHLDHCQATCQLVDLAEVQKRIRTGVSPDPCVSITFDDGYAENGDFALPLMIERGIPVTYFVSTDFIRHGRPFPHDVENGQPLRVHSPEDLRQWADAGVEIGCHTRDHVDFSTVVDPRDLEVQIVEDKDRLEQMIGRRARYFAFPFGLQKHLQPAAISAVHRAGFDGFCSAFGGYNVVGNDWFHLRRFHGDPEFSRLLNWLSFDAHKLQIEPEIDYPQRGQYLPDSPSGGPKWSDPS